MSSAFSKYLSFFLCGALWAAPPAVPKPDIYAFNLPDIKGKMVAFDQYKDKVLLLVNVASNSSFTPQYSALEALYQKHKAEGLVVLAFPSNDFGAQEPDNEAKIEAFCQSNYHITFPLFSKIAVRGDDTTPLFSYLTKEANPKLKGDVHWNFSKFLVDRKGKLVARFSSDTAPDDPDLEVAIENALKPPDKDDKTGKPGKDDKATEPPPPDAPTEDSDRRPPGDA